MDKSASHLIYPHKTLDETHSIVQTCNARPTFAAFAARVWGTLLMVICTCNLLRVVRVGMLEMRESHLLARTLHHEVRSARMS